MFVTCSDVIINSNIDIKITTPIDHLDVNNKIVTECSKLNINSNGLSDEEVKSIKQRIYEEVYDTL